MNGFAKGLKNVGTITKTVMVAIAGGTASMLGGGKFANGAMSAAFVFMFNELAGYPQKGRFKGEEHHNGQYYMKNGTRVSADGRFLYVDGSPYAIHQDSNVGTYILVGGATVVILVNGGAVLFAGRIIGSYLSGVTAELRTVEGAIEFINSALPATAPGATFSGTAGYGASSAYEWATHD